MVLVFESLLLTQSLCSFQGFRSRVGHIETLDSHAALLHQLLALVLLQIQPSSGGRAGALEGEEREEGKGGTGGGKTKV